MVKYGINFVVSIPDDFFSTGLRVKCGFITTIISEFGQMLRISYFKVYFSVPVKPHFHPLLGLVKYTTANHLHNNPYPKHHVYFVSYDYPTLSY